ncbi:hypothetical protein AAFF_G00216340 [Aldrovandia affinis]|uniref:F-box domain-containing protein n=1 Tax=Aldrovandia affinis TaxID=143900 RepID=A0AAD7RG34_9TELE|nr:hypothetical protein AAFF_G00216340 [Aldrovandia affinis]
MVALVERRTGVALRGLVSQGPDACLPVPPPPPPPHPSPLVPPLGGGADDDAARVLGRGRRRRSLRVPVVAGGGEGRPATGARAAAAPPPPPPEQPPLCRLYRRVSHRFLEIRVQIQRLLEPRRPLLLLLPDHVLVGGVLSLLPTRSLAALKCTCRRLRALIDTYCIRATDALWTRDPLYRDDPCKQCRRRYERGDVSLCRWHPKPYHHDLPYGRSYWMCCRCADKDTPGCRVGLHDNNWVQPCEAGRPHHHPPPRGRREDGR